MTLSEFQEILKDIKNRVITPEKIQLFVTNYVLSSKKWGALEEKKKMVNRCYYVSKIDNYDERIYLVNPLISSYTPSFHFSEVDLHPNLNTIKLFKSDGVTEDSPKKLDYIHEEYSKILET